MEPPPEIAIKWCPVCGRDDRYQIFTGKSHFSGRDRCAGQPVAVVYRHPEIKNDEGAQ